MAQFFEDFSTYADENSDEPPGWSYSTDGDVSAQVITLEANRTDLFDSHFCGWVISGGRLVPNEPQLVTVPSTLVQADIDTVEEWGLLYDAAGSSVGDFDIVFRARLVDDVGFLFWDSLYVRAYAPLKDLYLTQSDFDTSDLNRVSTSYDNPAADARWDFPNREYCVRVQVEGTAFRMRMWAHGDREPDVWDKTGTLTADTGAIGFFRRDQAFQPAHFTGFALGTEGDAADWPYSGYTGPATPTLSAGIPDEFGDVVLTASAFSGGDGSRMSTHWQVDLTSGDFSDPAVDYWTSDINEDGSITVPTLPPGSYKARVKKIDEWYNESAWSSEATFTVSSRSDPPLVDDITTPPGQLIMIRQLGSTGSSVFYGVEGSGGSSAGGSLGGVEGKVIFDDSQGRYCEMEVLLGGFSGYASDPGPDWVTSRLYIVNDRRGPESGALAADFPKVNATFSIEDRVTLNEGRRGFISGRYIWAVHLDNMRHGASGVVGSDSDDACIGFRCIRNEGDYTNWHAFISTHEGDVELNEDSGVQPDESALLRITCDFWNKTVAFYVNRSLVASYSWPSSGTYSMDQNEWGQLGRYVGARFAGASFSFLNFCQSSLSFKKMYSSFTEQG